MNDRISERPSATTAAAGAAAESAKPDVSLLIVAYRDEHTVRQVVARALAMLEETAAGFEVIVVDDASPDRSGAIADEIARADARVSVIHHEVNRGYGAAFKSGIAAARHEWVCMVDGDDEYDVFDLKRMLLLRRHYPLVIAFRYKKLYSARRIFISYVYNSVLRLLFRTRFRDVSTGIRVVHRDVLAAITLTSDSPFMGAELAIKAMLHGYPVGEVGIQTFPRSFGAGSAASLPNILKTIRDIFRMRREVFSDSYNLPQGRSRE